MARKYKKWSAPEIALLRDLAASGLGGNAIAIRLGRSQKAVFDATHRFQVRIVHRKVPFEEKYKEIYGVLNVEASKRGTTRRHLVFRVLRTIADEPNLIDAILDDGQQIDAFATAGVTL